MTADATGILATWIEPAPSGAKRIRFARLAKGGWSAPSTIAENASILSNFADVPTVVRSGAALWAAWTEVTDATGETTRVVAARSVDDGDTWTPLGPLDPDAAPGEHGFASLVADGDGARAFWLDARESSRGGPMTLRTVSLGQTVGVSERLDARVCDCCSTSALGTPDGPAVVYRDRSDDELRDPALVRRAGGAWAPPSPIHADGWRVPGCPVNGPATATRGRRVVVAWFTYAGSRGRVLAAFSQDAGASFGTPVVVDEPHERQSPVGRVDVVLEESGDAIVSWLGSDREDGTIRVRRVRSDGAIGRFVDVARTPAGRESGFPRLAALGSHLVVAWTEAGSPPHLRAVKIPGALVPGPVRPSDAGPSAVAPSFAVGAPAPPYEVRDLDGAGVSLASLRGRPVLLDVWATWCEPCRMELPELTRLHERYAPRGLAVVAASVDAHAAADEVRAFAARRRLPFPVWRDPDDLASRAFGIASLPVTLLFDREGTLRWRSDGAIRADDPSLGAAIERGLGI